MTQFTKQYISPFSEEEEMLMDEIDSDKELIEALVKGYNIENSEDDAEVDSIIAHKVGEEMDSGRTSAIKFLADQVVEEGTVIKHPSLDDGFSQEAKAMQERNKSKLATAISNQLGRLYIDCEMLDGGRVHSDGNDYQGFKGWFRAN